MNDILEGLNEQQKAAVLQRDGAVLIIAGAGSGKTRVLTSRIAMLLQKGVPPQEILALTFTRKAAGEMKQRIAALAGPTANQLVMGTFHSVFVRFLRTYNKYLGLPSNFVILDENDSLDCIKECTGKILFGPDWNNKEAIKNLTEEEKKQRKTILNIYKPKTIATRISMAKNELISPKEYADNPQFARRDEHDNIPETARIYASYMGTCYKNGTLDFDDILFYTDVLLSKHDDILKYLSNRFRYILVDEYQDTNHVQYDIMRMLSATHGNICVVGDDSQSIYAFRGAKIQNILDFKYEFKDYHEFKLETNYRSTPSIVTASNQLIKNNAGRLPKDCHANKSIDRPIQTYMLRDDRDEAIFIASTIRDALRKGTRKESDFAILYRTNAQSRELETALMRAKIPYAVYSGMSFYERQEIKDVLAYMRLAVNPHDDEAFKRVCNRPARGISDPTFGTLRARANQTDSSIYQTALALDDDDCGLKPAAIKNVKAFLALLTELNITAKNENARFATEAIFEKTGILQFYEKEDEGADRVNNIKEIMNGVLNFVDERQTAFSEGNAEARNDTLLDYIEDVSLLTNLDENTPDDERVSLMTSHCSKGLEFPVVFIAGVEEGLFPLLRPGDTKFDEEEERRLFYVSITRAMEELILLTCQRRRIYGEYKNQESSRFIKELRLPDLP